MNTSFVRTPSTRSPGRAGLAARLVLIAAFALIVTLFLVAIWPAAFGDDGRGAGGDHANPVSGVPASHEEFDGFGIDDGEVPAGAALTPEARAAALDMLAPELRVAVLSAAEAARQDGIELTITSGWRSAAYQSRLFDEAVRNYGSAEEASRWVAEPHRSAHVQGLAVDIGPTDAYSWLDQYGARFGLCRTFANEGWHFELRDVADGICPVQLGSAAEDPRSW